jgi:hypothetical protein
MMNRKGAIELSANFIVIMVISSVILVGGLGLFYKMILSAKTTVETLDGQTREMIKDMMTDGDRTAVYPKDAIIGNGDSIGIGIGVTNIYDVQIDFTVRLINVKYYADANSDSEDVADMNTLPDELKDYADGGSERLLVTPHNKDVKEIILKMPRNSPDGEYVYTIAITDVSNPYGLVQVYVSNK